MNYHNITHDDMNNGDGLRVVLWVSGCSHHCPACHNPQTWEFDSGVHFDTDAMNEIFEELSKDYVSGITFSGGDPLFNRNLMDIHNMCVIVKSAFPTKTIWLYTGFTFEEIIDPQNHFKERKQILEMCDVLVDGQFKYALKDVNLKWRGSSNQRVIDVQKSLKENRVVLWCD